MKIISNARDLSTLDPALASFIRQISPWVDDEWNPEEIGYLFVLGEEDVGTRNSVCAVPSALTDDGQYIKIMTIDLETYDLWESPSFYDENADHWNVVAIFGNDYGCSIFMSSAFVQSIPSLEKRMESIQDVGSIYHPSPPF